MVKVALGAIKGALQQLAQDFEVHPTLITMWKKLLMGQVARLFKRGPESRSSADEEWRQAYGKIFRLDEE